jgi:glycosyltransferase involved in cell wall biosynthesis
MTGGERGELEGRARAVRAERGYGPSERPVILCVVDRPGWAHDRKTEALASALADRYRIVKRFQHEVTAGDLESADLLLLYYWMQVDRLGDLAATLRRRRDRLLVGICSELEVEGAWREPGLALLAELPCAVFANSLALVRRVEPQIGRAVLYTPNGVDTDFFRPPAARPSSGSLRVGWAGSLTNHGPDQRGVHQFIAPAVARVPGARLCLAAREERWRGLEEMRDFYRSLDVYVCASQSEGTPNPCLEAAASGLPVVTTRVGNMPELIRDGESGFFVERDVADIAGRLDQLRRDPELRARLGHAARTTVEAWDWRHKAGSFDAMFRGVLGGIDGR